MKIIGERKAAAARLAELTGERAVYTKMPRCAYEVGPFTIERDGTVKAFESADLASLRTLAQEGLLEGWEEPVEESPADATEAATEAQDADVEAEDTDSTDAENPALTISLPLSGHTATSLRNLVTMIYTRGPLISKATGGNFACPLSQVTALKDCLTLSDAFDHMTDALVGLTVSDEKINFTGFPMTDDPVKIQTFTQLAAQMNKAAKAQKRVMAKAVDATNEKYIFRIWLLSIGMGGQDYATARRILLVPLSGSAAFKDSAMENRWKEKQAAKRDALRIARENEKRNDENAE